MSEASLAFYLALRLLIVALEAIFAEWQEQRWHYASSTTKMLPGNTDSGLFQGLVVYGCQQNFDVTTTESQSLGLVALALMRAAQPNAAMKYRLGLCQGLLVYKVRLAKLWCQLIASKKYAAQHDTRKRH